MSAKLTKSKFLSLDEKIKVKRTKSEEVISLIRKLHPYNTDKELIRIGPNGDGGYLVPDDLTGIEACFSPGVGQISSFEEECSKLGMKVFLADKSVDKPNLDLNNGNYSFLKKYIGCTNNVDFITMDEWVNSSPIADNSDLILQMDIEGSEYYTFINMTDLLIKRFRIMIIEFHGFSGFWLPHFFSLAETVFDKILQTHTCVHIHPNNCSSIYNKFGVEIPKIAEFTFLRNDRINSKEYQNHFPHHLDFNNTEKDTIVLPRNWYNGR